MHDQNAELVGTKNDEVYLKKHSYFIYEIHRCNDGIRDKTKINPSCSGDDCETVDPPCMLPAEIDDWTKTKRAMFKVINNKVDFTDFNSHSKQSEMFLPSIDMSPGHFSDQGFRFRWNIFTGIDKWWPGYGVTTKHFFDV